MQKSSENKKKKLIVVAGPTAVGKTGIAIYLAHLLSTEIISCDSRQFYKEMKIGTAVPSTEELNSIPHHFIQHLSIFDAYSVGDFERDALAKIDELFKKHDTLIMVGGSGLYEKAITHGLDSFPEVDKSIREKLNIEFNEWGIENLQKELAEVDPIYFKQADIQNPVRIIRALEIYRGTGKPFSSFRTKKSMERDFEIIQIGLELPREEMYQRINQRVEIMKDEGLLEEAKPLYEHRNLNSLQTVGYRELFDYLDGKIEFNFAIEEIKKNSRRYAKRQLTWYKKQENRQWFSPFEKEEIWNYIQSMLNNLDSASNPIS